MLCVPASARASTSADDCGVPAVGTASPVGTTLCFGARPGAYILVPRSNVTCTLGFLLKDPKTGRAYMTTSGHCVLPATGERKWPGVSGPVALDDAGKKIGTFVFAIQKGTKDFALLAIDKKIKPNPQVCHFGGPTGLNDERFEDPEVLSFYGQADLLSEVLPARSGVTANTRGEEYIYVWAPVAPGDSGGPWLMSDGKALGYLTHLVAYGARATDAGVGLVRRLGPQLAVAERALKTRFALVTAPQIP
jgi:hypothetical protein